MMHQDKDRSAKWLIEHFGGAILKLAGITGFTSWKALANETVAPRLTPDGLIEVEFAHGRELVLIEIESYPGAGVDEQVFEDILLTRLARKTMPRVICLVLHPKGKLRVSGTVQESDASGTVKLSGEWPVVNLWDLEAEVLFALGDVGLIPWATLTKTNLEPEELLTRCVERISAERDENKRKGLMAVTEILAGLAFPDRRFLKLFGGPEAMIESPVLEEAKELIRQRAEAKAKAEAWAEAKAWAEAETVNSRQFIIDTLELRFGLVPPLVSAKLTEVMDATRLRELHRLSVTCPTLEAFETALQAN